MKTGSNYLLLVTSLHCLHLIGWCMCLCLQILSAYLKYMTGTGVLLGGERNETERLMAKVVEFEQAIANVCWSGVFIGLAFAVTSVWRYICGCLNSYHLQLMQALGQSAIAWILERSAKELSTNQLVTHSVTYYLLLIQFISLNDTKAFVMMVINFRIN